jgi:hypothetical protein
MKAKLIFKLPEESEEYELHMSAGKLHSACWDFAQWLRGVCKHDDPKKYDAEACRAKFYEFLQENDYVL